jgi:hypothetical protein
MTLQWSCFPSSFKRFHTSLSAHGGRKSNFYKTIYFSICTSLPPLRHGEKKLTKVNNNHCSTTANLMAEQLIVGKARTYSAHPSTAGDNFPLPSAVEIHLVNVAESRGGTRRRLKKESSDSVAFHASRTTVFK